MSEDEKDEGEDKETLKNLVNDGILPRSIFVLREGKDDEPMDESPSSKAQRTHQADEEETQKGEAQADEEEKEKGEKEQRGGKVLRLIPERLRGADGIVNVLEQLLDHAKAGRLSYVTFAYGIDRGFGRVESKASWRVRDPGDHESARDIVFALEQLKFMCLTEWTDIERIEE